MTTQTTALDPETFDEFTELDGHLSEVAPAAAAAKLTLSEARQSTAVVVADARNMRVQTPQEAAAAAAFIVEIKSLRQSNEAQRKKLTAPLLAVKKELDEGFKQTDAPYAEADSIVRGRLKAYEEQAEQERKAEEARLAQEAAARQRVIDEQRAAAEAQAREARRAAEAEAARIAAEAQQAEADRQAELAAHANQMARNAAVTPTPRLEELVRANETADDVRAACMDELNARVARDNQERLAREAEEAAQAARAAEATALTAPPVEVAVAEMLPAPVSRRPVVGGSVTTKKKWTATVVDEELVPRRFLVVDQAALNRAMHAGERDIPGVDIKQVTALAVSAR